MAMKNSSGVDIGVEACVESCQDDTGGVKAGMDTEEVPLLMADTRVGVEDITVEEECK